MSEKFFFDIHCHAMNLSHPNLLALIKPFTIATVKYVYIFFKLSFFFIWTVIELLICFP